MHSNRKWQALKEAVKERFTLEQYLSERLPTTYEKGKQFRCINPDHADNDPSCGVIKDNSRLFHCFGCQVTGDLFTACHFLEGRPLEGRGFITENLIYLAEKLGVPVPREMLSEEEMEELQVYSAQYHAALFIQQNERLSEVVRDRLARYGWPDEMRPRLGVGSVTNYDSYIQHMTKSYGYSFEYLRSIDLTRKAMFDENNLIFTIRDEDGSPVGFAARNLRYEELNREYEKQAAEIEAAEGKDSVRLLQLVKPRKYINSDHERNHIYRKGSRLFNFHLAKKHAPPLYVVEGYSDAVTLYVGGLKRVVAIGSTSFTPEHLQLIMNQGINHLIFVLDSDQAGIKGTERFVHMLKDCLGDHVGLRAEIVAMPEGTDDPDAYVHRFHNLEDGVKQFCQLHPMDVFTWTMHKQKELGEDRYEIAKTGMKLIVNEPNFLLRMQMSENMAKVLALDYEGIWQEVLRSVDQSEALIREKKLGAARRLAQNLQKHPEQIEIHVEATQVEITNLEKERNSYAIKNTLADLNFTFDRFRKATSSMELRTGWARFDRALNGIPAAQCFLSVPGKPNQGKSTFLDNLALRLVEHNPGLTVLFHTVDDSHSVRISRLIGAKTGKPSEWFKKIGYWGVQDEEIEQIFAENAQYLTNLAESERLIIADVSRLPGSLPALEAYIKNIRAGNQNDLVVMGDNFHLYDLPGFEPGENKVREMSRYIKRMCNQHNCTILMTMELPKESLRAGVRPRISRIKGTSGVAYDANANLGIYNDMKDRPNDYTVHWVEDKRVGEITGPGGVTLQVAPHRPVLEVIIDKSKISSFDGTIFFKLDPESGHIEEASEAEQVHYAGKAESGYDPGRHSSAPYRAATVGE